MASVIPCFNPSFANDIPSFAAVFNAFLATALPADAAAFRAVLAATLETVFPAILEKSRRSMVTLKIYGATPGLDQNLNPKDIFAKI